MTDKPLLIICNFLPQLAAAQHLALQLNATLLEFVNTQELTEPDFALVLDEEGVALQQTGRKAPGPIRVDFTEGAVDHRRKFGGGKGQMIAKAVGVKAHVFPRVLDATAGLGKDAFVLATLGCRVHLLERSPIVHALLSDGLARALHYAREHDNELLSILHDMELIADDSHAYLSRVDEENRPHVVYLDPMFPDRDKSADVKKEMRAFHTIVGKDDDADGLLDKALALAVYRVVVKRPRKAPFLANRTPSYQLEGKSSRFDIYTIKKMPDILG